MSLKDMLDSFTLLEDVAERFGVDHLTASLLSTISSTNDGFSVNMAVWRVLFGFTLLHVTDYQAALFSPLIVNEEPSPS